ncbi:bifunctional chorismate mutase/prephenate dehydratase [Melittangium boletus]|uniref:Bifunctional chorismate mutase/prephenate dehydratase n=1 Tax=Melittangium boletus DSM 14713 TaxID=1294270 RepID=A0A286NVH9_9BACT|nr:bifunctional chorismate mutase/prephenate dehydratase [Melittangium boletus]ATB27166.1 bifunctional chorismate mutase/prephenate dehydratase [Melittangium boletus DSM 14713]
MSDVVDLQQLRVAIEQVDEELLDALRRRMDLAEDIARSKLATASPIRDQRREDLLLRRIRTAAMARNLDPHEVERLYRFIMEMSVARQHAWVTGLESTPLRVAYPGIEGSYSHQMAHKRYAGRDGGVFLSGFDTPRLAVDALRRGEMDLALLPIENTTAGAMYETYDALVEEGVTLIAEVVDQVQHRLLGLPGARLESLHTVRSHPQAITQCETFFRERLPHVRLLPDLDTGGAAQRVREANDPGVAAIASDSAAQRFGLEVLAHELQDRKGDFTRFVEVARAATPLPTDAPCKTSLVMVLENKPGTLGKALLVLAERGVNLARLESRPLPGSPWCYRFFLDLEGHAASAPIEAVLRDLQPYTQSMRLLGTYPRVELLPG